MNQITFEKYLTVFYLFHHFNLVSKISQKLFKPLPCHKFQYLTVLEKCCMPSAYLQWWFHSGERVVACGPLVFFFIRVLRPFQEYFTYIELIVHQRWAKTGEPGEKTT